MRYINVLLTYLLTYLLVVIQQGCISGGGGTKSQIAEWPQILEGNIAHTLIDLNWCSPYNVVLYYW